VQAWQGAILSLLLARGKKDRRQLSPRGRPEIVLCELSTGRWPYNRKTIESLTFFAIDKMRDSRAFLSN